MPMQDAAAILGEILSEADALIRLRLKEQGLELPHLVVGATPDNQTVVRSNGDADVIRSFGEDLKNVADELTAPPEPGERRTNRSVPRGRRLRTTKARADRAQEAAA
jgi:hypothetical protein